MDNEMITTVSNPTEFQNQLEKSLIKFLEENQQFNVQGSWTGDDGITVSVLVDFGIEDRDLNDYYVGSVSARHQDNLEFLEDHEERELAETETFEEAEESFRRALWSVFSSTRGPIMSPPHVSDIDTVSTANIDWMSFEISDDLDIPEHAHVTMKMVV
jgi:hypothetical protein